MTFKQFMTECEMFKYSQANYEFMKEASELELMESYIENQKFLIENAEFTAEASTLLTESFLFESSEDTLVLLEGKYRDKIAKFAGDVKAWLIKILTGIANAFKRIGKAFKDGTQKGADVIRKLTNITEVTEDDKKAIKKVIDGAIETSGAPISEKQINGVEKLPRNIIKWNTNSVNNKLAAALVNTKIQTTITSDGPYNSAIAERHINKFFDKVITNFTQEGDKGTESLQKTLDRYITESRAKGIVVSADSGVIEKFVNQLESYRDKIESKFLNKEYSGKMSDIGHKFFESTSESMAHCIALYRSVNSYRLQVIVGLSEILKKY